MIFQFKKKSPWQLDLCRLVHILFAYKCIHHPQIDSQNPQNPRVIKLFDDISGSWQIFIRNSAARTHQNGTRKNFRLFSPFFGCAIWEKNSSDMKFSMFHNRNFLLCAFPCDVFHYLLVLVNGKYTTGGRRKCGGEKDSSPGRLIWVRRGSDPWFECILHTEYF